MAQILRLNTQLETLGAKTSTYGTLDQDRPIDMEDYHMLNMVASTDPELLHKNYATRLAMMTKIEQRLAAVLQEKAEQVTVANREVSLERALEATRISLRNLGIPANQNLDNLPLTEYRRLRRY